MISGALLGARMHRGADSGRAYSVGLMCCNEWDEWMKGWSFSCQQHLSRSRGAGRRSQLPSALGCAGRSLGTVADRSCVQGHMWAGKPADSKILLWECFRRSCKMHRAWLLSFHPSEATSHWLHLWGSFAALIFSLVQVSTYCSISLWVS